MGSSWLESQGGLASAGQLQVEEGAKVVHQGRCWLAGAGRLQVEEVHQGKVLEAGWLALAGCRRRNSRGARLVVSVFQDCLA